jgi:hypothetical protein
MPQLTVKKQYDGGRVSSVFSRPIAETPSKHFISVLDAIPKSTIQETELRTNTAVNS